ncbi:MAG: hypothetical protein Q4F23_05005 [Coriobacteriia bacterium]|nr:hypothetical protein [Coriobacteriia bacterium]
MYSLRYLDGQIDLVPTEDQEPVIQGLFDDSMELYDLVQAAYSKTAASNEEELVELITEAIELMGVDWDPLIEDCMSTRERVRSFLACQPA